GGGVGQSSGPRTRLHSRDQHRKHLQVAAVERKLSDALVFDHLSDSGIISFERHRLRRDFYTLGYLADFKLYVDARFLLRFDAHATDRFRPKSRGFYRQMVFADVYRRKRVFAARAGGYRPDLARRGAC